jgi:hypothetical protein
LANHANWERESIFQKQIIYSLGYVNFNGENEMSRKKVKIINGVEMYYCPDCDDFIPKDRMTFYNGKPWTYCKKHRNIRSRDSERKRKKWLLHNEKNKLDYRVSNTTGASELNPVVRHKVSIRPRATGACKNWGKPRYEKAEFLNV